jgi:hypothetical protein
MARSREMASSRSVTPGPDQRHDLLERTRGDLAGPGDQRDLLLVLGHPYFLNGAAQGHQLGPGTAAVNASKRSTVISCASNASLRTPSVAATRARAGSMNRSIRIFQVGAVLPGRALVARIGGQDRGAGAGVRAGAGAGRGDAAGISSAALELARPLVADVGRAGDQGGVRAECGDGWAQPLPAAHWATGVPRL